MLNVGHWLFVRPFQISALFFRGRCSVVRSPWSFVCGLVVGGLSVTASDKVRTAYRRLPSLLCRGLPSPPTATISAACRLGSRRYSRFGDLRYDFVTGRVSQSAFSLSLLTFLLLNQTFYPNVMATGQYLTDLALGLVERGHQVTVLTSRRAYDHPEKRFPKRETWRGINIIRVGSTGLGKTAKWRRAADFASFILLCALRLAFLPRHDAVVALTSPPLISFLGAWLAKLRRARFYYWVMDFNPDEAIAAGWLRSNSLAASILERMSRFSLRHATKVIALDRFMRDRILAKGISPDNVVVLPPWSHDTDVRFDLAGRDQFRQAHGLTGKFVVMYSGNHSPCHPLDTLLQAAERMQSAPDIVFLFIGGGSEWRKIQPRASWPVSPASSPPALRPGPLNVGRSMLDVRCSASSPSLTPNSALRTPHSAFPTPHCPLPNVLCLPYEPLSQLAASLSAADLHIVIMGAPFVGLVHPCKIYNILRVQAPVLYIGPRPSHITDILECAAQVPPTGLATEPTTSPSQKPCNAAIHQSTNPPIQQSNTPPCCGCASHGDVEAVIAQIQRLRRESRPRQPISDPALPASPFSKQILLPKLIAELEAAPHP